MEYQNIMAHVDHTLLAQSATWEDIRQVLDDAMGYGAASACIPPSYVKRAAEYVSGKLPICTVIGFPNGYSTTATKVFEAAEAAASGASEIDMVINVGWVKDGRLDAVGEEIARVRRACPGKVLKVIIEICLLTEVEIKALCGVVAAGGADYIKTSTGFSTGGATFEAVELMRASSPASLKIKAAGGIASFEDAERFLALGADRLGTSRLVKLLKAQEGKNS